MSFSAGLSQERRHIAGPAGTIGSVKPNLPTRDERYRVGSVARALQVIDLVVDAPRGGLSLSEISRAIGVSKSTAYALIQTLLTDGHLRVVVPGPRYLPGPALIRVGDASRRRYRLASVAQAVVDDLARSHGLVAWATGIHNGRPLTLASAQANGGPPALPLGLELLPHCTAAGKAILAAGTDDEIRAIVHRVGLPRMTARTLLTLNDLLADLDGVRRRGMAIDDEEFIDTVFGFGVALVDATGACLGAVGVSGYKSSVNTRRVAELSVAVRDAAGRIAGRLATFMPGGGIS
jgi:IclR family acetate operon transcriptional repressor